MFYKLKKHILITTTSLATVFLISLTSLYSFAFPLSFIYYLFELTLLLLVGLLLINLGLSVFAKGQKLFHLSLCLLIMATFSGMVAIPKLIGDAQEKWFLRAGRLDYEKKIIGAKQSLTSNEMSLDSVFNKEGVWGKTNIDGSILFTFQGRGGWNREGYMYYSGDKMTRRSSNSNIFFFPDVPRKFYSHIADDWYLILR